MVVPAGVGGAVEVVRPRVVVAAGVRERDERLAQALVAGPAEAGGFAFAGLDRDGGLPGVGGERVPGGVARAAVADLGQELGGADHTIGLLEQRQEDGAVGVLADGGGDLALELLDLLVERLDRRHQAQDQRPADAELELADPGLGGAAELCEQLPGLLPAGVVLADEESAQARFSQAARVVGAGVALEERERDLTVQAREQSQRAGPEPRQLSAQLVGQRGPGADQIFTGSGQRSERLGLIRVGLEHPKAVMIGPRQLAQHERVKPVGLPTRRAKPITSRRDLIGMQRQDPQPGVQQPLDQQPVGPLDRDQRHLVAHQCAAQPPHPGLVVRERRGQNPLARLISDQHVMLLGRPIDARIGTSHQNINSIQVRCLHSAPTKEVPLRMPIDRPSKWGYVLLPLAAPHHRREGLVHERPSTTGAGIAKPSPGGGRGNNQDDL